jgi:hypothetical protein
VIDGNRSWEQMINFGAEILNWNVRFVVGYPGTSFMVLAIRRGETDMVGTSNWQLLKEMYDTGGFVGVAQLGGGNMDNEQIEARTEFQKVPTFNTLVEGKTSGITKRAFDFWTALNDIDKWYALPPNTPPAIVKAYRDAWAKMVKDPEFIRLGKLQFSADFEPVPGEKQQQMVNTTAYPDPEIPQYMEALKVKYGLPGKPLSDEEIAAMAKAKGLDKADIPSVQAKLAVVTEGGREIEFPIQGGSKKLDVSSSRTKVTIAGKTAARGDLKAGMDCKIEFMSDAKEATGVACN